MGARGFDESDPQAEWTLFGRPGGWQDEGTPAFDLKTGEPVLPEDHDGEFWRAHGYRGTGRIVCLDCWAGSVPGVEPGTRVALSFREPGDRRSHFTHPAGQAHDSLGGAGESVWHLRAKRVLQQWAATQPVTAAAELEWTTSDRARRANVRVTTITGHTVALEAQQRPLPLTQWRQRRASYAQLDIGDYWFWPTTTREPRTTPEGLTSFAIDPDHHRLGLIASLRSMTRGAGEAVFEWPSLLLSRPLAALWAPMSEWRLDEAGHVVPPQRLADRCVQTRYGRTSTVRPTIRVDVPRLTQRPATPRMPYDSRKPCIRCGWSLDPILNDVGRHPTC